MNFHFVFKPFFWLSLCLMAAPALGEGASSLFDVIERPYLVTADRETSQIMADCPPAECQYISMGLTNTLFDSFLRIKLEKRGIPPEEAITYAPYLGLKHALANWPEPYLEELFQTFLPSRSVKKIVFIRTLHSGLSVETFFGLFGPFMKKHFPHVEVAAHLLVVNQDVASFLKTRFREVEGLKRENFKYVISKTYVDHIAMRKPVWNKNDFVHELDDFYQINPLSLEWMYPENFHFRYKLVKNSTAQNLDQALAQYLADPDQEFIKAPAVPVKKNTLNRIKAVIQSCSRFLQ